MHGNLVQSLTWPDCIRASSSADRPCTLAWPWRRMKSSTALPPDGIRRAHDALMKRMGSTMAAETVGRASLGALPQSTPR